MSLTQDLSPCPVSPGQKNNQTGDEKHATALRKNRSALQKHVCLRLKRDNRHSDQTLWPNLSSNFMILVSYMYFELLIFKLG